MNVMTVTTKKDYHTHHKYDDCDHEKKITKLSINMMTIVAAEITTLIIDCSHKKTLLIELS
ncbi:hypothetical protein GCM10020331_100390 [Ectobacillus funiculus]